MEELQKQNEILAGRLEKAKEVFKDQKKQIDEKNAKIAEQQTEINNLKEQLQEASKNDALTIKIENLEKNNQELESKWNDKVIENDELALELNKAKTEALNNKKYAQEYSEKLEAKTEEYNKQVEDNKQLTQQLNQASADLQEFKSIAEKTIKETKEKADKDVAQLKETFANQKNAYEQQIEACNNDKAKIIEEVNVLKNTKEELTKQLKDSTDKLNAKQVELDNVNKKLQDANNKLNTAKTSANELQNQVKQVVDNAQKLQNNFASNFNIFQ